MLAEKLNKYKCGYNIEEGDVDVDICTDDDSLFDEDGYIIDSELRDFANDLVMAKKYCDEDPRDSALGITVFVELNGETAWWDEGESLWV